MYTKNSKKEDIKVRNNSYYNMEEIFDDLYAKSLNGNGFYHLMEIITSENNIKLAYRNIKKTQEVTPLDVMARQLRILKKWKNQKLSKR